MNLQNHTAKQAAWFLNIPCRGRDNNYIICRLLAERSMKYGIESGYYRRGDRQKIFDRGRCDRYLRKDMAMVR